MTYARTPYADAATPAEMAGDCLVVDQVMQLPHQTIAPRHDVAGAPLTIGADLAHLAGRFTS